MSPTIAAGLMTMRAHVKRNEAADDGYGGKATPADWQTISPEERCWVWSTDRRHVSDGGKSVVVEDLRAMFRGDADLARGDRFTLHDRRERDLFGGDTFEIETVTDRFASGVATHREVMLRRIRA